VLDLLMELVAEGVISPERIRQSADRIQTLKARALKAKGLAQAECSPQNP